MVGDLEEEIHFHTLRHTYASWLAQEGVDLFAIKELLGHAEISTTQIYAHLTPGRLRNEVERVFGAGKTPRRVEECAGLYRVETAPLQSTA